MTRDREPALLEQEVSTKWVVNPLFQRLDERLQRTALDERGPILETCTRFLARPGFLSKAFLKKSKRRVSSMPEGIRKVGFPENGRRYSNIDPV